MGSKATFAISPVLYYEVIAFVKFISSFWRVTTKISLYRQHSRVL